MIEELITECCHLLKRYPSSEEIVKFLSSPREFIAKIKFGEERDYILSHDMFKKEKEKLLKESKTPIEVKNSLSLFSSAIVEREIKDFSLLRETLLYRRNKRYLILTKVSYPFGGGESFMYQTIEWMTSIGFEVVWLSFCDKFHRNYSSDEYSFENGCHFYKIPGGLTSSTLEKVLLHFSPDVIHIQGVMCSLSYSTIKKLRIPTIIGYHFWFGLLTPNQYGSFNNIDIIGNIDSHSISNFYLDVEEEFLFTQYVVSDFMNNVLLSAGSTPIKNVVYATSDDSQFLPNIQKSPMDKKYITLVNINKLKGGDIFLEIVKRVNFPLIGICTEPNTDGLDEKIKTELEKKRGMFLKYTTNIKKIYDDTRILLLPGHVDETFCRAAYEAAACGIPIITTGVGFIREMLGDCAIYLSRDPEEWVKTISEIYTNKFALNILSDKLRERSKRFKTNKSLLQKLVLERSLLSKNNNVCIFCPWCDQGLGIQSKGYTDILLKCGYRVHIFSFLPFLAQKKNHYFQKNPEEWENYTSIYYSYNDREKVTLTEIEHFVFSRNIGKFIIPEVCFPPIYEKVKFLKSIGVEVFAIPNIETVRVGELNEYLNFTKILCNTRVCEKILKTYLKNKSLISYIGHYTLPFASEEREDKKRDYSTINFLHVSGYNAITRKQTKLVCEAFALIDKESDIFTEERIILTITSSKKIPEELLPYVKNKNIIFDCSDLSYSEIRNYYKSSHCSIQVASHEGLGLGFYESIAEECPVISLECAPHNEIVTEQSGWLIECTPFGLRDNDQALVSGYTFKPEDLKNKILEISANKGQLIKNKITRLREYSKEWSIENFTKRFIVSLEGGDEDREEQ